MRVGSDAVAEPHEAAPYPRLGAVRHRGDVTAPSLWRHADFLKLWTGQTVSELGSVVTRTAVPLVALLVLGAGATEMALAAGGRRRAWPSSFVGLFAGPGSTGFAAGRS